MYRLKSRFARGLAYFFILTFLYPSIFISCSSDYVDVEELISSSKGSKKSGSGSHSAEDLFRGLILWQEGDVFDEIDTYDQLNFWPLLTSAEKDSLNSKLNDLYSAVYVSESDFIDNFFEPYIESQNLDSIEIAFDSAYFILGDYVETALKVEEAVDSILILKSLPDNFTMDSLMNGYIDSTYLALHLEEVLDVTDPRDHLVQPQLLFYDTADHRGSNVDLYDVDQPAACGLVFVCIFGVVLVVLWINVFYAWQYVFSKRILPLGGCWIWS